MSFKKFNESNEGTYVGAKFDAQSVEQLVKLQKALGVKNPLPSSDFHVTVLYSRNKIDISTKDYSFQALPIEVTSWESDTGEYACVLKLVCPELNARHEEFISQGGTHDFDDYQIHVTLSYNHKTPDFPVGMKHLNIVNEYTEPLNLDWVATK